MDTNFSPSSCKEQIRDFAISCGFDACGFAEAAPVDENQIAAYRKWLDSGKNGTMDYMCRHLPLRDNPSELFPDAKTIISLAANYYPQSFQPENAPQFAYYAYGKDYHDAVKCRLSKIAEFMKSNWDCECRCCVDTAPLRERYWAAKAGIGFIGKNNQLIIPHKGSYFFLGEILTTLHLPADKETNESHHCGNCRKCIDACPANALQDDFSAVDARRCLSCLTIELRGDLPDGTAERLGNKVYGCDECQKVCPHNRFATPARIDEFRPTEEFLSLSFDNMANMDIADFQRIFRKSAVKRTKYTGLMRNLEAISRPHASPADDKQQN